MLGRGEGRLGGCEERRMLGRGEGRLGVVWREEDVRAGRGKARGGVERGGKPGDGAVWGIRKSWCFL